MSSRKEQTASDEKDEKFDHLQEAFKLASKGRTFHDSCGTAYIRFEHAGAETLPLEGKPFSKYFRGWFFKEHRRLLTVERFEIARAQLLAQAGGDKDEVCLRVGQSAGAIYLDLCNERKEVLKICPGKLQVVNCPPVNFIRPPNMKPLPVPRPLKCTLRVLLAKLLPQLGEKELLIVSAFLVGSQNPSGPYMLLQIVGPQGSGKSTLLRFIKRLLDPGIPEGRSLSHTERDLMIALQHNRLLCFDNISKLSDWQSDALCRIATGGGIGTRELYSNGGEIVFDAKRPLVINGIGDVIDRPDLKERALVLNMPEVAQRRTEGELRAAFDEIYPSLVGALARCVRAALSPCSLPEPETLPRMADWYLWVRRALPEMGFSPELLDEVMAENRRSGSLSVLEASPVALAVIECMKTREILSGTPTDLWTQLETWQESVCAQRAWPGDGRTFSNELRRVEPELRSVGIFVERHNGRDKRTITIRKSPGQTGGGEA